MVLKVYVDRLSQPSRAVLIFCKVNRIDFEEVRIDIFKRQHRTNEFKEINPMGKLPAITDGRFKLFESHAILSYLATVFPGVPDHWYPTDLFARARIQSILDWHHSNLRVGTVQYIFNTILGPRFGSPVNPQAAKEAEKVLKSSLYKIETIWLKGNAKFLLGNLQPSIADLSLACEIMQLELLEDKDCQSIIGPYPKILVWIDNVKSATSPHFEEVHEILYRLRPKIHSKLASITSNNIEESIKSKLSSKL